MVYVWLRLLVLGFVKLGVCFDLFWFGFSFSFGSVSKFYFTSLYFTLL